MHIENHVDEEVEEQVSIIEIDLQSPDGISGKPQRGVTDIAEVDQDDEMGAESNAYFSENEGRLSHPAIISSPVFTNNELFRQKYT